MSDATTTLLNTEYPGLTEFSDRLVFRDYYRRRMASDKNQRANLLWRAHYYGATLTKRQIECAVTSVCCWNPSALIAEQFARASGPSKIRGKFLLSEKRATHLVSEEQLCLDLGGAQ